MRINKANKANKTLLAAGTLTPSESGLLLFLRTERGEVSTSLHTYTGSWGCLWPPPVLPLGAVHIDKSDNFSHQYFVLPCACVSTAFTAVRYVTKGYNSQVCSHCLLRDWDAPPRCRRCPETTTVSSRRRLRPSNKPERCALLQGAPAGSWPQARGVG